MAFLDKLQQAINNEWTAQDFYKQLKERTTNTVFKDFIQHAINDELKHFEEFQQLHYMLAGRYFAYQKNRQELKSFEEGVLAALEDELKAAEMYRDMLLQIPVQQAYAPLFRAMVDELEHGTRFSTIYGRLK